MTEKNIIDNVEQYFESVKEQYGDILFLERSKNKEQSAVKIKKAKQKTPKVKIKVDDSSSDKHRMTDNGLEITHNELSTPTSKLKTVPSSFDKLRMTDNDKLKMIVDDKLKMTDDDWESSSSMKELYEKIHDCQKCPLGATRTNFVFGTGNPNADIMIIGEAPGADEDEQGKPFVGRAGQLLTKILEAIKLSREEVFIANILKCRPPNNRKPLASEENECEPYLKKQIELIKPAFILALGLTAVDCLLKKTHKMGDMRGSVLEYHGIKMLVTYHPAALLRNPNWKPQVWEDVKLLRKLYNEYLANR